MSINITLLCQVIVFAALIAFTMRYIWPPVMRAMDDRKKRISEGLAAADRGVRELEEATSKADEEIKEARNRANEILANAQRTANEAVEQSRADARAEGDRLVENARAEIDHAIAQARDELRQDVGTLAVRGAERILKREIDAKAHNDIIDDLVAGIR